MEMRFGVVRERKIKGMRKTVESMRRKVVTIKSGGERLTDGIAGREGKLTDSTASASARRQEDAYMRSDAIAHAAVEEHRQRMGCRNF